MTSVEPMKSAAETPLVILAKGGDHAAFEELVRRRQSWIRNLMRRLSKDATLADDLAQQIFLQTWRSLKGLQDPAAFGGWLKRLAITTWLQHERRNDPLQHVDADEAVDSIDHRESKAVCLDLDRALATLSAPVRLCVVLSYKEGMSHAEIADLSNLPLGTVKSHIQRGAAKLRQFLTAYSTPPPTKTAQVVEEAKHD